MPVTRTSCQSRLGGRHRVAEEDGQETMTEINHEGHEGHEETKPVLPFWSFVFFASFVIFVSFVVSGCASTPDRYYVQVAEGLTSPSLTEGIRVAPRRFAASQLVEACKDPLVVARLEVAPNPLELREDGRYELSSLSVVAVNAADVAMSPMPIVLEVEERSPPVVQLRSDDPDLNAGRLHVVRAGEFRMRVRTMCGTPHVEVMIRGLVTP